MAQQRHSRSVAQPAYCDVSAREVHFIDDIAACKDWAFVLTDRSTPLTKQTSPLRQRMIDNMTIRNTKTGTQKVYIRAVKNFSLFFQHTSPRAVRRPARDHFPRHNNFSIAP
jgi:hypothetical protein